MLVACTISMFYVTNIRFACLDFWRILELIVKLFLILDLKWRRAISSSSSVCVYVVDWKIPQTWLLSFCLLTSPQPALTLLSKLFFYTIRSYTKNPKRRRTRNARRDTRHHHRRVKVIEHESGNSPRKHIRHFFVLCFLISRWLKIKLNDFLQNRKTCFRLILVVWYIFPIFFLFFPFKIINK